MSFLPLSELPGVLSCNYISGQKCCQKILTCCGVHDKWVAYVLKIHSRNSSSQREPHTYIYTLRHIQTHAHKQKSKQTHIYQTHINNHTPKPHTHSKVPVYPTARVLLLFISACVFCCVIVCLVGLSRYELPRTFVYDSTCILQQR